MKFMEDIEAFAAQMINIEEMGLDKKVLEVFQEAGKKILAQRDDSYDIDWEKIEKGAKDVADYLEEQKKNLSQGSSEYTLDEQFEIGVMYLGDVAMRGKLSDSN